MEVSMLLSKLSLGIRKFFIDSGFETAVIGLSGGIDSAVVACLAVNALGADNVICVAMPSDVTAKESTEYAQELAYNLRARFYIMPIQKSIDVSMERFRAVFGEYNSPITIENLHARERGKILMEIANDTNSLVLATGNKTEIVLGYCTLYGDTVGALAPIGDVSKLEVYELVKYINSNFDTIPQFIIDRKPTAELSIGQKDPFDYKRMCPLLDYINNEMSIEDIMKMGYTADEVEYTITMIHRYEFKKHQMPPIIKRWRKI